MIGHAFPNSVKDAPEVVRETKRAHLLREANNYANLLILLQRFEEAKSLAKSMLLKAMPVARRVLGEGHRISLKMRWLYAAALFRDDDATLTDLREAVTRLEEIEPTARRVLGGAHPITEGIEESLRKARAALRARETADVYRSIFGTESSEDSS